MKLDSVIDVISTNLIKIEETTKSISAVVKKESRREISNGLQNIQESFSKNFETVEKSLTSKISLQESNMQKNIKSYAETVSQNFDESAKTNKKMEKHFKELKSGIETKLEQENQQKQRIAKENNICIFNVPESNKTDRKEAFGEDISKLHSILDENIFLKKEDLKAIYRVGIKHNDRPRPIVMKLTTNEKKIDLLKLRGLVYRATDQQEHVTNNEDTTDEEAQPIRIFISPDRTRTEQENHRRLVSTLKERIAKGEKNLYIRNGKILQYQPFRGDAQLCWANQQ